MVLMVIACYGGRAHQARVGTKFFAGQINYDAAGDNSPGEGEDMRGSEADRAHEAREHRRGRESLQLDAGLRERTPIDP